MFKNMDEDNQALTIIFAGFALIIVIMGIACYLSDLHDEKMASLGCSEEYLADKKIWKCKKESPNDK